MKKIANYLIKYVKENFDARLYVSISIFLIICIIFNYYYDFEDNVLDQYYGTWLGTLYFFIFQAFPYYSVCLLIYFFDKKTTFFKEKDFWLASIVGFIILACDRSVNWYSWISIHIPVTLDTFIYKCTNNLLTLLIIAIPLYVYYQLDKQQKHFYGIRLNNLNLKPYFVMLLLVIPLVIGASLFEDFLIQYPMYQRAGGEQASGYWQIPEFVVAGIYELGYAMSFFSVELFFRGFLIFGIVRYMGAQVVLPMIATYAFFHFGKPMGETIGSIFGGYILGIIALYSRNIWGGVIVHVGLALLMELAAWMQNLEMRG